MAQVLISERRINDEIEGEFGCRYLSGEERILNARTGRFSGCRAMLSAIPVIMSLPSATLGLLASLLLIGCPPNNNNSLLPLRPRLKRKISVWGRSIKIAAFSRPTDQW